MVNWLDWLWYVKLVLQLVSRPIILVSSFRGCCMGGILHDFIEAEGIQPGDRLPPERDLSRKLGLPRTALRRELAQLEKEGRLIRHVGRGTFLSEQGLNPGASRTSTPSKELARTYPAEVFEARLIVEPKVAAIAATRATPFEIEEMRKAIHLASTASSLAEFEKWDAVFHRLIVQSARNNLLSDLYESIHAVRSGKLWGRMKELSLTPARMARYTSQHQAIHQAFIDRDGGRAEAYMLEHIADARNATLGGDDRVFQVPRQI
jgi:DNA-binding FadR family transcriptional regulator